MAHESFICVSCKTLLRAWFVYCPSCGNADTVADLERIKKKNVRALQGDLFSLDTVKITEPLRFTTGIEALDCVTGGGLVSGAVTLLAGSPGAGKSRLALQFASHCGAFAKLVYVSGEETRERLAQRCSEMNLNASVIKVSILTETSALQSLISVVRPDVLIIDSLQTIHSKNLPARLGSPSQVLNSSIWCVRIAQRLKLALFAISHVTKDENISGPNSVEHNIDVSLYLDTSEKRESLRVLSSGKNRFGPSARYLLEMTQQGLIDHDE